VSATQEALRFEVFELNLDAEELRRDGTPIKLPRQAVKVLALLASRAGQVVTRDEMPVRPACRAKNESGTAS